MSRTLLPSQAALMAFTYTTLAASCGSAPKLACIAVMGANEYTAIGRWPAPPVTKPLCFAQAAKSERGRMCRRCGGGAQARASKAACRSSGVSARHAAKVSVPNFLPGVSLKVEQSADEARVRARVVVLFMIG